MTLQAAAFARAPWFDHDTYYRCGWCGWQTTAALAVVDILVRLHHRNCPHSFTVPLVVTPDESFV